MNHLSFEWCGPPLGGDSTVRFHRSFKCCYRCEERSYSLGDLCWIKSSREAAVCIVQIHTLWEKVSNGRMFAGGRLFFRPEDTPKGRYPEHGQDEVLLWNRTVVLRCSELVEWHLRAQMAPLWPSGTMATYRPEWEVLSRKTPRPLSQANEENKARDQGYKKSSADIGRPSLKRTSLFASGLAVCELDDMKSMMSLEQGKGLISKTEGSKKHPETTQKGLQDSQRTVVQKQSVKPRNGRRSRVVSPTSKAASSQKRGRKKVSPLAKKATGKRTRKIDTVAMETGCVCEQHQVVASTSQPMKSESNCTGSCGLVNVNELLVEAHEKQPNEDSATVIPPCLGNSQSNQDGSHSIVSIKEESSSSAAIDMSMSSVKPELNDSMIPEEGTEKGYQCADDIGNNKATKHVQSMPGRVRRLSQLRSLNPAAPLLARARKIKLETKRRQSREQADMEKEDSELPVQDGIQSSELDENEEDNEQKREGNDQKPQRKRGRKRKKVDSEEVSTKKRHVTVRRTSVIVRRDIAELFALSSSFLSVLPTIVMVSYSHYCRYKALQLRLAEYERLWCHPDVESMTGMKVADSNTRLVFCRALFKNPNLLKLGVTMAMSVPSFVREERGRRKRRGSFDSTSLVSHTVPKRVVWSEEDAEREFMESLHKFMAEKRTPMGPPPRMGFQKVNLFAFFNCTQQLGGYDEVTGSKLWRDVYLHMGGTTLITSAAASAKKQYEKYLLAYERHIQSDASQCQ